MIHRPLLILAVLWMQVIPVGAATYHVATTGADTNPGTGGAPFATLQRAINAVRPGDTINVRAGSYAGFSAENLQGAPDAWITIRSHPGEKAVIDQYLGDCGCDARDGIIYLGGVTAYVIFDGLEITNSDPAIDQIYRKLDLTNPADIEAWRKFVADPARARTIRCSQAFRLNGPRATPPHHLIFRNLVIHHLLDVGFSGTGNDMEFLDNHIYDLGWPRSGYAWYVVGERITWRGNVVHDTVYGFHLRSSSKVLKDSIIENNVIYNNGGRYWHMATAGLKLGGAGIYISADGGGNIVRNNLLHGNLEGIHVYPKGMEILGNTVYRNTRTGMRVHGGPVRISDNLISANGIDLEVMPLASQQAGP